MTNSSSDTDLNYLFVTHIQVDGPLIRIWGQTNKNNVGNIERHMHLLTPQFNKGLGCPVPQSRTIEPDVICCALYEGDYYRGKICSVNHPGNYTVQFIDYGNTEVLSSHDIRLLDGISAAVELKRAPPLACDFVLADVLPRGLIWDKQIIDHIKKDIRYSNCSVKFLTSIGKTCFIRMNYRDRNLADILLEQNLAVASSPTEILRAYASSQVYHPEQSQIQMPKPLMQYPSHAQHTPPRENPSRKYSTTEPVMPLRAPRGQHYQENWRMQMQSNVSASKIQSPRQIDDAAVFRSRILEIGSKHEVSVSYVEDGPLMFSVQVKSTADELNTLMYHINQTHPQPLNEPPVIGSVCLGRYAANKSLLRAVVMQVREHDCKLHYVDFGHGEILPYSDIYQLPRQYINPRVLSIRFTLSNVNELRISDELKDYFKNYVDGKTLLLHVRPSEGSPLIQYGDLYDNGRSVRDVLRSVFGDAVVSWQPARKLSRDSREIVQVVYIDFSTIFVQLDSDAPLLESLVGQINEYVATAPPFKPSQLAKGLPCMALSSTDSQWYRAEITNVTGDTVTVFYVDYGNEETIPATAVRSIRDSTVTKIRAQAIRCIINDYENEVTTNELRESLETEIIARPVAMIVTQVTPAGPIVDLYDSNVDPLVNIIQRLKRASVANGNVESRSENYNDRSINSAHSNIGRRSKVKKPSTVGQRQKSKSQNVNAARDDQTNKWNNSPRSEAPRISESNNSTDYGKFSNRKNEENEPRRYDNRDNRYQNREKEWSPNTGQQHQNDRFSRNDGKNDRATRDGTRYERNDRYDRSGDSNANNRSYGGSVNNNRYSANNSSRSERNGSAEKAWSDKDSDTSSRGSGRNGRRGGSGGRGGRREGGRAPSIRDGENDRGGFKNARTNGGAASRIRDNRRDFNERNEREQQFDAWTSEASQMTKKISIPAPNITVGAVKYCEIVFTNDPTDFHVQLSPDNLELDPVMEIIATNYENAGIILERTSIEPGIDCIARYSEDSRWYRANVRSVEANGATVHFVDYGNVETVEFDKIKELDADCARLSAQAIACKLLAASKSAWDANEIDKFRRLTDGKYLEAEFVNNDNNVYEILLREIVDGKTNENYINEEFSDGADIARAKNNALLKVRQHNHGRGKIIADVDYATIDEKWPIEDMSTGTKENVIITWFTNPDSFYCQSLARKDEFRQMMNDIQNVYAGRQPIDEPLQVGLAVMAVFSDDGALYRAEILELNKARGNIVRYIDFGNTAMVEQRKTYRVEKKFMKIPKQAVMCSLKNIVPANGTSWATSNKQEIEKCFEAENFECTFHENNNGKYIISLKNGDVDVAGLLVEKSLASFAVSAHVHADKSEVETMEKPQIEELPRFDITLLAGQVLRVKVSNVESAAKFHIQLPSANASEKIIDAYMTENDPKVMPRLSCHEVCPGAGCLVNTDEGWRRAVVVSCSRTTGFDVRLIDTGANDEIPLDCMLALPGPLSVMQNQAVECCLKNATTNIVLDEKLRDRIENTYVIVAVEEVDNNRLIVKLYDTNGKIIKLTGNEEDEYICPICPMPILYSKQKVTVSHVEHSSSVWLKRNHDFDTDNDLLSRMYDHYSAPSTIYEKPPTVSGTLCAARSIDENWYRAKILASTDRGATVLYIDYGNSENVTYESLRVLEQKFLSQPRLSIEVALMVTLAGSTEQQREILDTRLINEEFEATMYNVHKKWIAELANADGKISEKLASFAAIETIKNPRVPIPIPEMTVGERYRVTCHHADSPAAFWLQRNEEISMIEELQEKLQLEAANCPNLDGIPDENTLCLAMYSVDEMWYRAEVIDADTEITSVRFVDYGNTDIVYTNQGKSKKITDSLKSIKRYATKCRLDVIPCGNEDWTCPANEWFEGIVTRSENMEALVIADGATRRVELFIDNESLVDELVKRNYGMRIDTEDDLIEEPFDREVDPRAAYVSHAISPNEFWIQQEKYVGELEILADRFIVADMFPKPEKITDGLLCVAKFPEDESWYRARVLSHADTGTEVIYIDYGNSAVSTEIREIPDDVAAQPAFSKKCRLSLPDDYEQWSEIACVEFVKMAADGATIFQLDIIEENEDISIVRLTKNGTDIVEILSKLCPSRVPISEERLSPLGEENSPNIMVSHANSPSEFFIHAENCSRELELMIDYLATAESLPPLEKFDEGTVCAAKFPEDEQWYRARILSHGDAGTEVLYIDYGNSSITTELRILPSDMMEKPALSTCCALRMPDDIVNWSREACEKFFELVNEGITIFGYEILDETEQTVARLSIDGNDIVEILAPLCPKKSETRDDIDNSIVELSSLRVDDASGETNVCSEERSSETSGIEIITISDTSSLDDTAKSENSTIGATLRIPEVTSQDETILGIEASRIDVTEIPKSLDDLSDLGEVANSEKIVDGATDVEKISEKVPDSETIAEEASTNDEKIVDKASCDEKIAEEASSNEKIVENIPIVEKISERVTDNETIVKEALTNEKAAEEASSNEKIVENVSMVEKIGEKVTDNETIVKEALTNEKIADEASCDEKIAEEASSNEKIVENVPMVEKIGEKVTDSETIVKEALTNEKIADKSSCDENIAEEASSNEKIVEKASSNEKIVENVPMVEKISEKVTDSETIVKEALTNEKIADEASCDEKIAEEASSNEKNVEKASSNEKIVENVPKVEKISEKVTDSETIVKEALTNEKIADEASCDEKIAEEASSNEKIVEKASSNEKIVENVPKVEKISEKVTDSETIVKEALTNEKIADKASCDEKIAEEASNNEKIVEKASSNEKIVDNVPKVEKISEKVTDSETIVKEALTNEKIADKASCDENIPKEASNNEKVTEKALINEKIVENVPMVEKISEKVTDSETIVKEALTNEKIVDEASCDEKIAEEASSNEKIVDVEKISEKVTDNEEIVKEASTNEKIVDKASCDENIPEEASNNEKVTEKASINEKIVENVPKVEKVNEKVANSETIVKEASTNEKIVDQASSHEQIVEKISLVKKVIEECEKIVKIEKDIDESAAEDKKTKTSLQVPETLDEESTSTKIPITEKILPKSLSRELSEVNKDLAIDDSFHDVARKLSFDDNIVTGSVTDGDSEPDKELKPPTIPKIPHS